MLGAVAWLAALEALWGDGEDYAFLLLLVGVPWLSGRGVRAYRVQAARLRELASRLEEERAVSERVAVARERHRMAHETHDAIAHAVGEMVLQASGAEQVLAREPDRARRALAAIQGTGREAVDELRQVLGILRAADANPRSEDHVPAFETASRRRYWPASATPRWHCWCSRSASGTRWTPPTSRGTAQRASPSSWPPPQPWR